MKHIKLFENYQSTYNEIEFICYNTDDYMNSTLKINQLNLYKELLNSDANILPYMQDFSDENHEQRSLAVILLEEDSGVSEMEISFLAEKYRIDVDLRNDVEEWKINEILKGDLDFLYKPDFNNAISYDFDGVLHT